MLEKLEKEVLTTKQAAELLQVSLSAVQKAIQKGKLRYEQMGRDNWIEREEVERYRRDSRKEEAA